ncbi:MAG: hypothetical protein ACODTL_08635 [Brucella sp.]
MWISKSKKLALRSVTPRKENPKKKLVGRAPDVTEIEFTPQELFGAMARCSHLHPVNPEIVTFESECSRHLVSMHVDNSAEDFFLLPSVKRLKDSSRSHFVGVVGDGIAYLQMIRDGYVWCDHFENLSPSSDPETRRRPDFVFNRPGGTDVALMESKATQGTHRSGFLGIVEKGYNDQVSPHLGTEIGGSFASHGFSIGSWMKSPSKAELHVSHTAVSANSETSDGPGDAGFVRLGNYQTVLSLMFGPRIAFAARAGRWLSSEVGLLTADWLDQKWLLGFPTPYLGPRFWAGPPAQDLADYGYLGWASWPQVNEFALELNVAEAVFKAFSIETIATDPLAFLEPMDANLIARAKENGGAVFPDGFAVLGTDKIKTHVSNWNPVTGKIERKQPTVAPGYADKPIFDITREALGWRHDTEHEEGEATLYLTYRLND